MNTMEAFLSSFDPVPEGVRLPADIPAAYAPDSCLAEREDQFVWRVRRLSDGELFVLKAAALSAKLKDSQQTLAEKLIEDGVFTEEQYSASPLYKVCLQLLRGARPWRPIP